MQQSPLQKLETNSWRTTVNQSKKRNKIADKIGSNANQFCRKLNQFVCVSTIGSDTMCESVMIYADCRTLKEEKCLENMREREERYFWTYNSVILLFCFSVYFSHTSCMFSPLYLYTLSCAHIHVCILSFIL